MQVVAISIVTVLRSSYLLVLSLEFSVNTCLAVSSLQEILLL